MYYVALDEWLMEVTLRLDPRTKRIEADKPVPLFKTNIGGALALGGNMAQYMVAHDGRFLMRTVGDSVTASPITMILNWRPK